MITENTDPMTVTVAAAGTRLTTGTTITDGPVRGAIELGDVGG
jgi:hypothetical protein